MCEKIRGICIKLVTKHLSNIFAEHLKLSLFHQDKRFKWLHCGHNVSARRIASPDIVQNYVLIFLTFHQSIKNPFLCYIPS